jgi:hypothetical protein
LRLPPRATRAAAASRGHRSNDQPLGWVAPLPSPSRLIRTRRNSGSVVRRSSRITGPIHRRSISACWPGPTARRLGASAVPARAAHHDLGAERAEFDLADADRQWSLPPYRTTYRAYPPASRSGTGPPGPFASRARRTRLIVGHRQGDLPREPKPRSGRSIHDRGEPDDRTRCRRNSDRPVGGPARSENRYGPKPIARACGSVPWLPNGAAKRLV